MAETKTAALIRLEPVARPTVADQIYDVLQRRILTLDLPPGTKLSEAEVSAQLGVSRQPVREAFKRLAAQGFLLIRPQRSTMVSYISEAAILKARFVRTALETQTCREACAVLKPADFTALSVLIDGQAQAIDDGDREGFHALDEQFHREICARSGVGFVWDMIHDCKAHMDRIRLLSLNSKSQKRALAEHVVILEALMTQDTEGAAAAMTQHLARITDLIGEIKAENHAWFTDDGLGRALR
ncbi:GntR family transcriptional regulator [Pseudorhodobacter ferrugineus]|uniref:GntR family transcriptional regulator n=1 Tax=Pseudorhodobacter ferrugineus TaxID=77008 RepID=UPI001FD474A1|nr:GntR family transcriptional regulator [Pseudorhodobacter ferrugineus]